jgi:hypothetical protein
MLETRFLEKASLLLKIKRYGQNFVYAEAEEVFLIFCDYCFYDKTWNKNLARHGVGVRGLKDRPGRLGS